MIRVPAPIAQRIRTVEHLVARWWIAVSAGAPSTIDQAWALGHLLPSEQSLWHQMSDQDRFHAVQVAQRFVGARPEATRAEIAAALLHDVGKISSGLGTSSRVLATVIPPVVVPPVGPLKKLRSTWQSYRDHEEISIAMAILAGSDAVTIEMLRGVGQAAKALQKADQIFASGNEMARRLR